ncbi:arylamine N-acetyltransferase family protein [Tenggerimyces flavus]|uniref:Arylamine N-acetyltransferase n=1 Tax=Tenggerimyces flavus TaxID=1708749 RepID=A0ABV7Y5W7_9ACTN|nr:arylamine N-acetyltransferase [Tenggerimyces flavus]MBM7790609.1 arylamine N-acetyltransferase [Tenggerimyces flavus]
MTTLDVAGYLARLGVSAPGTPSVEGLRGLHRAQVERIPYEAIEIQLGHPTTIDPYDSAARIIGRHRGGYCYHLNGAFSVLLKALGYDVVWHRAGVQSHSLPSAPGPELANHLALTVHGLPSDDNPTGDWLVDAGLGDGPHEPLPLNEGEYDQGPFHYRLRPSEVEQNAWRFDHDHRGAFVGMDFRTATATPQDFAERHQWLSTSPESGFVRTFVVQRRDADGYDELRGLTLHRVDKDGRRVRTLETSADWFAAMADVFDLPLHDVDPAERERLWERTKTAHHAWVASQAATTAGGEVV